MFSCRTQTRFNAVGGLLVSVQKQLISKLNNTLEKKVIAMNERGLTSVDWAVYNNGTKRTWYSSVQPLQTLLPPAYERWWQREIGGKRQKRACGL